jgi:hypothetical protein
MVAGQILMKLSTSTPESETYRLRIPPLTAFLPRYTIPLINRLVLSAYAAHRETRFLAWMVTRDVLS